MQPTAGFTTHITCRLTAENRDQLRNSALGNRVWATFTFTFIGAKFPAMYNVSWDTRPPRKIYLIDCILAVLCVLLSAERFKCQN